MNTVNTVNAPRQRRPWIDADSQRAKELRDTGFSLCAIAREMDRDACHIRRRLEGSHYSLGTHTLTGQPRLRRPWLPSDTLMAKALQAQGLTYRQIAQEMDRDRTLVRRRLLE